MHATRPILHDLRPSAWRIAPPDGDDGPEGLPEHVFLEDDRGTRLHVSWSQDGKDAACVHLRTWTPGADANGAPALVAGWLRIGAAQCLRDPARWPKPTVMTEAVETALAWLDLHLGQAAQDRLRAVQALLAFLAPGLDAKPGGRLVLRIQGAAIQRIRPIGPHMPDLAETIARISGWIPSPAALLTRALPIGVLGPQGLQALDRIPFDPAPAASAHERTARRAAAEAALAAHLPQALPWLEAGLDPA